MTIGEKIARLRSYNCGKQSMSQEELADILNVSRQSVSKWEMNQASPRIENVLEICRLFSVSTDDLLRDDLPLPGGKEEKSTADGRAGRSLHYFGTDGFRGEAGAVLTSEQAFKVGRFLGWYYTSPLANKATAGSVVDRNYRPGIVIGKDTRRSSYTLEYAIASGVTASGADVYMLHVTTTPSVSYVTRHDNFDCGIMISASHNPYFDNGIKLVNQYGEKMDDETLLLIEAYLDGNLDELGISDPDLPLATREKIGAIIDHVAGRNRYIGYLISLAAHSYRELKIGLDCANGASWMIAPSVFEALGAKTYVIGAQPDGQNINRDIGSTHIETLKKFVRDNNLDLGFAFDGDADRCIAVDEKGNEVNGDHILYILGNRLKRLNNLSGNTVVPTFMSNAGLFKALDKAGIKSVQAKVGDRYIWEVMREKGYSLGGEQSGHIIIQKYATTGDGILTAIMLTEEVLDRKMPLSALAAPVQIFPQVLRSIKVRSKPEVAADPDIKASIASISEELGADGRILLRESGTEPVVRVMCEGTDVQKCTEYVDSVIDLIIKKGYSI